jgi:hypothetical protein
MYNGYRVFPRGKAAGSWWWPHTQFYCLGRECVGLYLNSFQWIPSHVGIQGNKTADLPAKKGATLLSKRTKLNFKTVKRLIKQKNQEKYLQEAITLSNKTQWQNIKSTWENNKNKPRKQAVALFRLHTGHDCLAAHLHRIKVFTAQYANKKIQQWTKPISSCAQNWIKALKNYQTCTGMPED